MSGNLKRKRPAAAAAAAAAGGPVANTAPPSPVAANVVGSSSRQTPDTSTLRNHLERSLLDLHAATSRIQSLLHSLSPPSRSPLTDLQAPPQSHTSPHDCSRCNDLSKQLSTLHAQIAQHEREKESWKAFKKWWLESLEKRERRHERRGDAVDKVVRRLDERTRRVWVEAGMVADKREEQQTEEQSEITLPVHATAAKSGSNVVEKANEVARDVVMAAAEGCASSSELSSLSDDGSGLASPPPPVKKSRTTDAPVASSAARPSAATSHPPDHTTRPSTGPSTTRPPPPPTTTAPYVDDTPIRNPHHRRALHASACPDCALFYSHLNSASTSREGDISRMACSRHRSTFQRAETPDGYWNIAFPTTQEAEEVNANARRGRGG